MGVNQEKYLAGPIALLTILRYEKRLQTRIHHDKKKNHVPLYRETTPSRIDTCNPVARLVDISVAAIWPGHSVRYANFRGNTPADQRVDPGQADSPESLAPNGFPPVQPF